MVPLLEAGKLPTFSRLIGNGAAGYLDNGDESLSPSIWNTIFTGRPVAAHGVQDFLYYRLPWSNRFIENPLMTKPSTDSFYGLKYLLELFPNPGLWEVTASRSSTRGRSTPFLWEILSFHSKTVAVSNPMVLDEDKKVNGAQISFREKIEEGNLNYAYPEELAEKWGSSFKLFEMQQKEQLPDDFLKRKRRHLAEQIKFTIEMMKEYQADLRIYYSHYIDTAAHQQWDFYAQEKFFLTELPRSLTREEWGQLVIDNIDDPGFNAYLIMDRMVETFSDANPDATFIIVSDHGMTYSGYEHFNSVDGVIIMSGPRIKKGITIQDAHILDITPTTLAALDTPISEKLEGKVIESPFIRTPIPLYISDYPESLTNASESGDLSLSDEEMERLRSLGYIQ
jgi:predicted AlkP superfamily phosphohydrolase/phosphomutase